jgi:hypothetical protein
MGEIGYIRERANALAREITCELLTVSRDIGTRLIYQNDTRSADSQRKGVTLDVGIHIQVRRGQLSLSFQGTSCSPRRPSAAIWGHLRRHVSHPNISSTHCNTQSVYSRVALVRHTERISQSKISRRDFKMDGELLQVLRALYGLKESPLL